MFTPIWLYAEQSIEILLSCKELVYNQKMQDSLLALEHQISHLDYPAEEGMTDSLIPFLDQELRPKSRHSITEEYPALFGDFPGGSSLFIEKDGRVASHVGVLVREFLHSDFRLKTGLIGSVATASVFRGMGMASLLLKSAIQELRRKRAAIAVLWSDMADFYLPLGFHRAGRETDFRFESGSVPDYPEVSRPFELSKDLGQVWRLYQRHELKIDRSLEEMRRLVKIPEVRIFVTETNGQLNSYIAINKGVDFKNYIHEWGGDLEAVVRNIASTQRSFFPETPLVLISPASLDLRAFKQIAKERWDGVVGLVKVLDRNEVLRAYENFLKKQGVGFLRKGEEEILVIDGQEHIIRTDKEFLKVVFGDQEPSRHPTLPFFLWGFDSI